MKILTKEQCKKCEGTGLICNPFYDELDAFIKEYRMNHNGEQPTVEEEDAWLKANGRERWPDEELECENCGGNGERQQWIDVKELAKIIKEIPC